MTPHILLKGRGDGETINQRYKVILHYNILQDNTFISQWETSCGDNGAYSIPDEVCCVFISYHIMVLCHFELRYMW